mmetsp:Transcript_14255/g.27790  ORF Transcript_14255/g.27790 Transcript_14255/m.27790 type:complete len:208 (+) Transcript_14255:4213-4836(+)
MDVAGTSSHVARNRRRILVLFVQSVNVIQVLSVQLEDHQVFALQIFLQGFPLQDLLELLHQIKLFVNATHLSYGAFDKILDSVFKPRVVHSELYEIALEHRLVEIQKVVVLHLELVDKLIETRDQLFHTIDAFGFESLKLLDRAEHVDEFLQAAAKTSEFAKNGGLVEVELLALRHQSQFCFSIAVFLLVRFTKADAGLHFPDHVGG